MAKLGTFCQECCFWNNSKNDCDHGLIDVFKQRKAEINWQDSFPTIDRVCPYKKNHDWMENESQEKRIKSVQDELYIKGTIIILADNKDNLLGSIIKINRNSKSKNFKVIVIYKKISYGDMLDICGNNLSNYRCLKMANDDIEFQIYKSLKFAINGYLFIIDSNKEFDEHAIDKVNNFVNKKMFRLLHIPGVEGLHESVSMIMLYKWLKGDLGISFQEKVKDISNQEQSDNQIASWKEVNEEYSH